MNLPSSKSFENKIIYPNFRYLLTFGRKIYKLWTELMTYWKDRPDSSKVIPDNYRAYNTTTMDSVFDLSCMEGELPADIKGSLFITQCLGSPEAYMVGDTNIVRVDFSDGKKPRLTNQLLWTPAAIARLKLEKTPHRFDFLGLMYLSPGLGMYSYTEGMYLLPDGRLAVTSDVDRPWVIEPDTLHPVTPIGKRDEWTPILSGSSGDVLGNLFAGYSNSHALYTDFIQNEVFLVSYQLKQTDGSHPVRLIKWDGYSDFHTWLVVNESGKEIEIKQSIHELVFTRDYILLADTAFITGSEMFMPWKNAPKPNNKTVVYIIDRKKLKLGHDTVVAKRIEVDEPCIHLIPEYENPDDKITVYMLQTPATNTAEIIRRSDRDMNGNFFPEHIIGYGTLPVMDVSSIGKHVIDAADGGSNVVNSRYLRELPYCWGPYLYTYSQRQLAPFDGQDLFVMFKGISKELLPRRIFNAYKDVDDRRIPIQRLLEGKGFHKNNSICRISTKKFIIEDAYVFPDRTLLYTIAFLDSDLENCSGYLIAGVVTDAKAAGVSSGHEYWIFEADDLAKGPLCKLGHPSLNNTTLFHNVYLPEKFSTKFGQKEQNYHIPLDEDYPKEELKKWGPSVLQIFEEVIWPYYDSSNLEDASRDNKIVQSLNTQRGHLSSFDRHTK